MIGSNRASRQVCPSRTSNLGARDRRATRQDPFDGKRQQLKPPYSVVEILSSEAVQRRSSPRTVLLRHSGSLRLSPKVRVQILEQD